MNDFVLIILIGLLLASGCIENKKSDKNIFEERKAFILQSEDWKTFDDAEKDLNKIQTKYNTSWFCEKRIDTKLNVEIISCLVMPKFYVKQLEEGGYI